jgi:hypothetical protein
MEGELSPGDPRATLPSPALNRLQILRKAARLLGVAAIFADDGAPHSALGEAEEAIVLLRRLIPPKKGSRKL